MDIFSLLSWKWLILISGLLAGGSRFFVKDQVGRMGVFQMAFWQDIWGMVLLFGVMWRFNLGGDWLEALLLIGTGLILGIGVGAFNSAIRENLTGTTVMAYALGQVGIVLGAIVLLGEWRYFDLTQVEGVKNLVMVIVGVAGLLLYNGVSLKGKWSRMLWLTVAINVASNLLVKKLMSGDWDPIFTLAWQTVGMWLMDIIMLKRQGQKVVVERGEVWRAGAYTLVRMAGLWLYLSLMVTQPLSLLSISRRVAIIGSSLLIAWVVFGEHKELSKRQWLGLVMGLVAFGLG